MELLASSMRLRDFNPPGGNLARRDMTGRPRTKRSLRVKSGHERRRRSRRRLVDNRNDEGRLGVRRRGCTALRGTLNFSPSSSSPSGSSSSLRAPKEPTPTAATGFFPQVRCPLGSHVGGTALSGTSTSRRKRIQFLQCETPAASCATCSVSR